MKQKQRENVKLLFLIILCVFSVYSYQDEINTSPLSPLPLSKYEETLIKITIDRVKQLKNTTLFENMFPVNSPMTDIDKYFLPPEARYTSPLKTDIPEFKEKSIHTPKRNEPPTFEDLFVISSPEKRTLLCKKIIESDYKTAIEKIINYLAYGSPEQALIVDSILPEIKSDIEKPLIDSFQNFSLPTQERRAIAYALGKIKSNEAVQYLWNELHTTSNYEMQYTCVQALVNMPHSLSLDQWLELVQSSSPNIALIACKAIFDYGGVQSEQCIRKIILGEIPTPQKIKEYALSRVSDYPIDILVPFLIEVMEKNPDLAINSANILKQKTGMNFGPAPQLWAKWWEEIHTPPDNMNLQNQENVPTIPEGNIHAPKIRRR